MKILFGFGFGFGFWYSKVFYIDTIVNGISFPLYFLIVADI